MAENEYDDDQTRSFTQLVAGTTFSHYKIISRIGSGGMGEVYLAADKALNRKVALKFLANRFLTDDTAKARFTREAQAMAALDHPNIVHIYEVNAYKGRPFFAMEYVGSPSLERLISENRFSFKDVILIIEQICDALSSTHSKGVIHRDLKPANIMIGDDGRVKILDFGLAILRGSEHLTESGSMVGTLNYMSPEQLSGEEIDSRSDLFSLGVIIYEMVSGRLPFRGRNVAAVMNAIIQKTPEKLVHLEASCPAKLQTIVEKLIHKDKSRRYQSASQVTVDLKDPSILAAPKKRYNSLAKIVTVVIVSIAVITLLIQQFLPTDPADSPIRIAVLPFKNQSEAEFDYFAAAVTEELRSGLTSILDLAVVSRLTSLQYADFIGSLSDIGRVMNVDYVLDGTINRRVTYSGASTIRIVAQLSRVRDDVVLWSKIYDTALAEAFSLQSDIVEEVCYHVGATVRASKSRLIDRQVNVNAQAYEYLIRGDVHVGNLYYSTDKNTLLNGLRAYEIAVECEPKFGQAIAKMSRILSRLFYLGLDTSDSCRSQSLDFAIRSLELEPDLPHAHQAMGDYYLYCGSDPEKALDQYSKAFQSNTNSLEYLEASHQVLRRQGNFDAAYHRMKRVLELEPSLMPAKLVLAQDCIDMRRYQEAHELVREILANNPGESRAHILMAWLHVLKDGDVGKALEIIQQFPDYMSSRDAAHDRIFILTLANECDVAKDYVINAISDSGEFFFLKARLSQLCGDHEAMKRYYDIAIIQLVHYLENPDNRNDKHGLASKHGLLGLSYGALGRDEEALRHGRLAIRLQPVSEDAVIGLYMLEDMFFIRLELGQYALAMGELEMILRNQNSRNPWVYLLHPACSPLLQYSEFEDLVAKYGTDDQLEQLRKLVTEYNTI